MSEQERLDRGKDPEHQAVVRALADDSAEELGLRGEQERDGYEIWDRYAARLIRDFDTEEEALTFLRDMVADMSGEDGVKTIHRMQLVRIAGGQTDAVVARGVHLLERMYLRGNAMSDQDRDVVPARERKLHPERGRRTTFDDVWREILEEAEAAGPEALMQLALLRTAYRISSDAALAGMPLTDLVLRLVRGMTREQLDRLYEEWERARER